jgi:hypothetical protein
MIVGVMFRVQQTCPPAAVCAERKGVCRQGGGEVRGECLAEQALRFRAALERNRHRCERGGLDRLGSVGL